MRVLPERSVAQSIQQVGQQVVVQSKQFAAFPHGVNKASEYSWFYIVCVQGKPGETIHIIANDDGQSRPYTRDNSLVFTSLDQWHWEKGTFPVQTDHGGLRQRYTLTVSSAAPTYISNTIFFDYALAKKWLDVFSATHADVCQRVEIGKSLQRHPLEIITFPATGASRGRILVTTGCHPAEPDLMCSQEILNYLVSPAGKRLRQEYTVDVMPMQNPDGYILKSCLNAAGINLYWNFRKDDKESCPEAYYLWRYLKAHPPLLYLDFHAYVHQYHRHPMPYLQSQACYRGRVAKHFVRVADRFLMNASNGYYRIGKVSMWPEALSTYVTARFNTVAYTKYHINLNEGEAKSRQRARALFEGLTRLLMEKNMTTATMLRPPYGQARADRTDSPPWRLWYRLRSFWQQAHVYGKAYYRYWRWRNRPALYKT